MKKISLLITLLLAFNFVNAQFTMISNDNVIKIKRSILLVILEEEDPKTIEKLAKKDPEALAHYKDQIAGRNFALKSALEKCWNFSRGVQYKSKDEAKRLMKLDNAKYTSLSFGTYMDYETFPRRGFNGEPSGWDNKTMTYNLSSRYSELANTITTLEINDTKSLILRKPLFELFLPNVYPSEADAVYGVQQLQYVLKYLNASPDNKSTNLRKHINSNTPQVKELTLLIDKNEVDSELSEEEIKKLYPYPIELVELDVIDKAIIEKDPKYAYVQIVETKVGKGNVSAHIKAGAADGKMYSYIYPKVVFLIKGSSLITYNQRIKDKHFEEYAEKVNP